MKTRFFYLACALLIQLAAKSQVKIGDNSTTINNASLLELETTNKGFVLPRVSIANINAASPLPAGLLTGTIVYNTNASATGGSGVGIYIWNGSAWLALSTGSSVSTSAWLLTGNSGLNSSNNFIGTTDAIDFVARTNNTERMRILGAASGSSKAGWIGMGISVPRSSLDVTGDYTNKNVLTLQNTSSTGFTSIDMLDNTGALKGTFGYANVGTGGSFGGRTYFNSYGSDILFTANSGNYHLFLQGGTGYIGINTNTPSERMHVVGNIYLNGAFMPGGTAGTSGYILTSAGANTSPIWKNVSGLSWSLTGNNGLNASTNFIGTTDNVSMRFRTNNVQRMIIDSLGRVGIATNTPTEKLDVAGNLRFSGALMPNNIAGNAGYFLMSSGANNPPTWFDASNYAWQLDGNPLSSIKKFGTTTNFDIPFVTNNTEKMRLTASGFLGIGVTNPGYKLSVLGTDPLYLSGVQATTTFGTDSLLTINAGVVKKTPYSSLTGNFWGTTGNGGTDYATNFLGTTDNVNLGFRTNNTERMSIDTTGMVSIGNTGIPNFNTSNPPIFSVDYGTTASNTIAYLRGSVDDYFQINLRNKSTGLNASADYVATADNGTDSTYYIDMGINNSGYGTGADYFGGPNDAYLYAYSKNLLIGTQKTSTDIIFLLDGGSVKNNTAMRIVGPGGNIVIGKGEATNAPIGNIIRGPNASASSTNIAGGSLTLQGGSASGTATGGSVNIAGGSTVGGSYGSVNINAGVSSATNINTGTSPSNITIGGGANNLLLPKFTTVGGLYYTSVNTGQVSTTGSNMKWDSVNNRLGIGTTTPSEKLDVNGNFRFSGALLPNNDAGTSGFLLSSSGAGVAPVWLDPSTLSSTYAWALGGNTLSSQQNFGTLNNYPIPFYTNGTERMRITNTGFVGIGTATPASDLTIYQSSGSGNSKGFTFTGNSIGGTSSGTGFLMSLGYNTAGNKQLWVGDADYAGNAAGSFARFAIGGTAFPTLDAVSGDNSLRRYLAFGVAGDVNSGVIFGGDNTSVKPGSQVWDNGNMTIGAGYKAYAAPANGLLIQGNVGIGTASPSSALSVLAASNPMYISGLTALTSLSSSDSVLTVNAGIVKKAPYTLLSSGSSGWSLTGNAGTTAGTNFLGTTDAQPLVIKSLNRQLGYFDGNLYSIALGFGAANNTSDHNVAIGYNATTNNQYTLALGYNSTASGVRSVAIGNGASGATASGSESVAIGYNAISSADQTVSLGYQAKASGQYSLALGYGSLASASQTTAIGYSALASAQYSNAIGYQAQATATQSTAIGYLAQTSQSNTILLGNVNTNNLYVGIGTAAPSAKLDIVGNSGFNPLELHGLPAGVAGTDNILTINSSGVVGNVTAANFSGTYWSLSGNAAAGGSFLGTTNTTPLQFKFNSTAAGYLDANNTALGTGYSYSGSQNTAIGYSANAANSATAVGANSDASQASNTAIGNNATANVSSQATAIGASSQAVYQYNTALGYNAQATSSSQETVIGASAQAQGQNNVSIGYSAKANGSNQITVIGSSAQASFQNNTAVGYGALATSNNQATSVGASSQAGAQNATALGYNAKSTGANSTVIGYNASTSQSNALILGDATNTSLNVGIGTATPANKLEITQGTSGNSGLRFTNLTSSSTGTTPTSNSDQTLTVNATGDVILNNGLSYVNKQTGAYTLTASDNRVIVYITSGSAVTITIPNTLPQGFSCAIIQGGAGQLTFSGTGLQNAYSQFKTPNQYASVTVQTPALGTNVLSGETSW